MTDTNSTAALARRIVRCRLCPRLVKHREAVAADPAACLSLRYAAKERWRSSNPKCLIRRRLDKSDTVSKKDFVAMGRLQLK